MFKPKDQIAYIPTHADGDIEHPDVQFGFITEARGENAFCRYWSKRPREYATLRTTANSELTPIEMLVHHKYIADSVIDDLFRELGYS